MSVVRCQSSVVPRLLPKSLFASSKTFFDKSKARSSPDLSGFAKISSQKMFY
jgi:hypothetical protein